MLQRKRFLQIWEITCSSATLAFYMESRGWRCRVITRSAFNKHNCNEEFWDYHVVPGRAFWFYLAIIKHIIIFRPHIILVRQNFEVLPLIRLFAPFTPIVLQFHGHEIRHKKKLPWQAHLATKRIVSTKDLVKWGEWYGTPIHPMFKPAPKGVRQPGTALFARTNLSGSKDRLIDAQSFAKSQGLKLTVIDRTKEQRIPHRDMPKIFQRYEWYLDLKGLTSKEVLSKTAIEFLHTTSSESPGKVLTDSGDIVTEFKTTTLEDYYNLLNNLVQ